MWKSEDDVFEKFAKQLQEFTVSGEIPKAGDQDMQYYLELQQERLKKRNIKMRYDIEQRKDFNGKLPNNWKWSDEIYTNKMECHSCFLTKAFSRDEKKLYKKKQKKNFYEFITYAGKSTGMGEELYCCPNCGAVSRIRELEEGCPYCGTHFQMDDLFPKVTNYYFVPDQSMTAEENKKQCIKCMLPCILVLILIFLIGNLLEGNSILASLLMSVFAGGILGGVLGYLIIIGMTFSFIFSQAKDTSGMLVQSIGSKGRFVHKMKQFSPAFSYEYFTGKVISLLQMLLFSEHVEELPYYTGNATGELCPDVVDSTYAGAIALKKFRVEGAYAELDVYAYVENMYDKGRFVKRKMDRYKMHLRKNISVPIDYHFSIKKIQCKNCAKSYDATKYKTCPSCGTGYEIGDDDWIVTSIEKK